MADVSVIQSRFARAGVPLCVSERPFVRNLRDADGVVLLDIRRNARDRRRPPEEVLLWPGREAELDVPGVDRDLQQLVLFVREPRRRFVERVWQPRLRRHVEETRWTEPEARRFLIGMDERHLFIARLPRPASSVQDAHRALRPAELRESRARERPRRQGEWFFLPATGPELLEVEGRARLAVQRDVPLGGRRPGLRGRPHVASEVVVIPAGGEARFPGEFARGTVRHPDHRPLRLHGWQRVWCNTEDRSVPAAVSWID